MKDVPETEACRSEGWEKRSFADSVFLELIIYIF